MRKSTGVEEVFNINDNSIIWYPLKNYTAYQATVINNSYVYIRSFKSPKQYPYGLLLKSNKNGNYEITDKDNQRIVVSPSDVVSFMDKRSPYKTIEVEVFKARNKRAFINPSNQKENVVRNPVPIRVKQSSGELSFPDFSGLTIRE